MLFFSPFYFVLFLLGLCLVLFVCLCLCSCARLKHTRLSCSHRMLFSFLFNLFFYEFVFGFFVFVLMLVRVLVLVWKKPNVLGSLQSRLHCLLPLITLSLLSSCFISVVFCSSLVRFCVRFRAPLCLSICRNYSSRHVYYIMKQTTT